MMGRLNRDHKEFKISDSFLHKDGAPLLPRHEHLKWFDNCANYNDRKLKAADEHGSPQKLINVEIAGHLAKMFVQNMRAQNDSYDGADGTIKQFDDNVQSAALQAIDDVSKKTYGYNSGIYIKDFIAAKQLILSFITPREKKRLMRTSDQIKQKISQERPNKVIGQPKLT